jgi:hypothetical protein
MMLVAHALRLIPVDAPHLCSVCVHLLQVFRLALVLTTQPLLLPLANGLARVYTCSAGDSWLHSELPCYGIVHSVLTVVGSGMLFALWLVAFVGTCFFNFLAV